jgi:hypothetical protein
LGVLFKVKGGGNGLEERESFAVRECGAQFSPGLFFARLQDTSQFFN